MPAVGQLVHQGGVAVEGEDDGLVPGKDHVVILVGEPVGVGGVGLELHQIHHIHHPQPHLGQVAAQDGHRCQGLQRGGVAAAGQHRVGLRPLVIGGPLPDADAVGTVLDGLVHGEPLGPGVLGGHHHIDVIPAFDTVVKDGEQAVGVRGQVEPHHVRLLVGHMVQEAGVLVGEAVVILLPHVGGQHVVHGGDVLPPGELPGHLEPFGVLAHHGVHDADESLVAVEKAVPPGEQVSLQPALAHVLGEHAVHNAPVGGQPLVGGA